MYDVLVAWETMDTADEPPAMEDYAEIWRTADKIVYSRSLDAVTRRRRGSNGASTPTRSAR